MQVIRFQHRQVSDLSHLFWMALLLFCSTMAFTQTRSITTVTLKTGMVIKGEVVTIKQGEYVEIKTPLVSIMQIKWEDIQSIEFDMVEPSAQDFKKPDRQDYAHNDSSYYFSMAGGFPFGLDSYDYPSLGLSANITVGKSINQYVNLGITLGYDLYWNPTTGIVPLGLEFKGRMNKMGLSPFYYVQSGYGFMGYSEYETSWRQGESSGGLFFAPGLGVMNKKKEHTTWFLQFGYKLQKSESNYWESIWDRGTNRDVFVTQNITFRRFDMKFGYVFN